MTGDQRPLDISKRLTERLDINLALQAADLGVWEVNLLTNQVLLDQRCCQLFGIDQGELAYLDMLHYIHTEDIERVNQAVQWALNPQSNGNYQVSYRSIGQDGRTHWIRSTGRRYFDQTGRPVRLTGVAQELTQQVEAQQQEAAALQQSEARFRTLIEEAPVATCLFVGRQMVIDVANKAMIQVWGKGPDVVGLPLAEALPELKNQHFLTTLDDLFTTGNSYEAKGGRADLVVAGKLQTYYFNYDFKPLRNTEGEVYAILETATDVTQQVLAQKRIEQSQRQLLDLFEQSPVGLATYSADDDHVIQWANPFFGELVARPPQAIVGKPLLEALPELKGQGFDEILNNVIATGIPFVASEVAVGVLREGQLTTIHVDLTYQPQKGPQGDVQSILVVATDVTQQVVDKQLLADQQAQLYSIVQQTPAPTLVLRGDDYRIAQINQPMLAFMGRGEEVIGQPFLTVMPEVAGQYAWRQVKRVYQDGVDFDLSEILVPHLRHGVLEDIYYNVSYRPLYEGEKIVGMIQVAIDVTQQVVIRQALEEKEAILRGVIEVAEMGTWELDMMSGITTYSGRLKELFEFTQDFLDLDQLYNPILEADRERLEKAVRRAADPTSDGVLDEEYTVITQQTGRYRLVRAQAKMFFDERRNPAKLVGSMRDITEQRQTQLALEQQVQDHTEELATTNEELAATNEELSANNEEYAAINEELEEANFLLSRSNDNLQQFAYVASHDLQEPLRKIQQFGDLLKTRYAMASREELGYLERMQSAAARMSVLIKDLLNYSRITNQRDTNSRVDLNQVVDEVLIDLELLRSETQARVEVDPLPVVEGDVGQLGQLFQNLLSNAIKFRRPAVSPHVQIKLDRLPANQLPAGVKPARAAQSYYQIEVIDNGIGFDEKYVDRIFQVFQRLHGKSEFAGTGIGLAICEKVVTNHGGTVTARSQPGQGATFTIYLPI